jgi:hypothetical protein
MGDRKLFLELLGEDAWPAYMCFPECVHTVSHLGRFMLYPMDVHIAAAYHLMGYYVRHKFDKITYGGKLKIPLGVESAPPYFEESRGVYAASDSSWNTRVKPQGGHVVMRMNAAILWSSKAMKIVIADSTCHAETAEMSKCSKSVMFVRMTSSGIGRPVMGPTLLLGDNRATDILVTKEGASSRSRHFELATIFVKYMVLRLVVMCQLVRTHFMIADIFTKATDESTFFRMKHELRNSSAEEVARDTQGAYARRVKDALARIAKGLGVCE